MKTYTALIIGLLLIGSCAAAQSDPDPDSMGIYFDTAATINTHSTMAPFEPVTAYLVITRPTGDGVSGWECAVEITGLPVALIWSYAGGGVNAQNPLENGYFEVEIGTGDLALQPVSDVCVVATMNCYVMNPTDEILFAVLPLPISTKFVNEPGYLDGGPEPVMVPCGVSSGLPYGLPCATINSTHEAVAINDMTWSGVKNLYK